MQTAQRINKVILESISIIKINCVDKKSKISTALKIINLSIMSKGERILSRFFFAKEYQPQKAINKSVGILEGSMITERSDDATYTPIAAVLPNSTKIKVTISPHMAQAV